MIYIVQRVGKPQLYRGGIWFVPLDEDNLFQLDRYEALHSDKKYYVAELNIKKPFIFHVHGEEMDFPIELYAYLKKEDPDIISDMIDEECDIDEFADMDGYEESPLSPKAQCYEELLADIESESAKILRSKGYDAVFFIYDGIIPEQIFYIGDERKIKWLT